MFAANFRSTVYLYLPLYPEQLKVYTVNGRAFSIDNTQMMPQ